MDLCQARSEESIYCDTREIMLEAPTARYFPWFQKPQERRYNPSLLCGARFL